MIWKRLRGHENVVEQFRRAAGRGRLAHAYAFCGPEGIGKKRFAETLATCLLCERTADGDLEACGVCPACKQMAAGTHPDLIRLGLPSGKKFIPIAAINGGDDGRTGLGYELSLRPMSGSRRIAIVDDAQHFNRESANALLKTLEEPPAHATLILLVPSFDDLLPTIRSRCQPIRFAPLPDRDIAELLVEHEFVDDPAEAASVAALSEGSLAVAAQLLDERVRGLREALFAALGTSPFDPLATSAALTTALDELKDRSVQRRTATWILRFAADDFRNALREAFKPPGTAPADHPGSSLAARLAQHGEPDELIAALLDVTREAGSRIDGNSPVPLVLEAWTDGLARAFERQPA